MNVTMKTITISLPEHLEPDVQKYESRAQEVFLLGIAQLKIQEALFLYQKRLVSIGRAAEIAGISQSEMSQQARAAGLRPHFSAEMAADELA